MTTVGEFLEGASLNKADDILRGAFMRNGKVDLYDLRESTGIPLMTLQESARRIAPDLGAVVFGGSKLVKRVTVDSSGVDPKLLAEAEKAESVRSLRMRRDAALKELIAGASRGQTLVATARLVESLDAKLAESGGAETIEESITNTVADLIDGNVSESTAAIRLPVLTKALKESPVTAVAAMHQMTVEFMNDAISAASEEDKKDLVAYQSAMELAYKKLPARTRIDGMKLMRRMSGSGQE